MSADEPKIYQPKMFTVEPWYSLEPLPGTSWLIKDFLPEGTVDYPYLMIIGGDPGSYKTTVLSAIFGSLATGVSFLGRKSKQRETLFVAAEDPWGAKKRGRAVFTNLRVSPEEITAHFFGLPVNLALDHIVNIAGDDIIGQGMAPKVIAFDTTFACSEGADLVKQPDMVKVLNNARQLCRKVGATNGILTHHNTKNSESLFGSVGLPATVDVIINCKNLGNDQVEITCGRMKMARMFPGFSVKLTSVKIAIPPNDEGETEEEWLVVAGMATEVARQPSWPTPEKELFFMVAYLELVLGNSSADKQWHEAINQERKKRKLAEWAERTWHDRTKIARERGLVVGGGKQRERYRTVPGWWIQPGWPDQGPSGQTAENNDNPLTVATVQSPLRGICTLPQSLGEMQMTAAHSDAVICSHSSQGSEEGQMPTDEPPETEEETTRKALGQLAARKA